MRLFGATAPGVPPTRQSQPTHRRDQSGPKRRRVGKPVWYLPVVVAADAVGVAVPMYLALRHGEATRPAWCVATAMTAWLLVRGSRSRYAPRHLGESNRVGPVLRDWLVLVGLLAVLRAASGEGSPFHLALTALVPCVVVTTACQSLVHRHLLAQRRDGRAVRRALVIGEASAIDGLVSHLARRTDHEFVVVGVCPIGEQNPGLVAPVTTRLDQQAPAQPSADSAPVLESVRHLDVDLVFIAPGPGMAGERLRRLSWAVHEDGCRLVVLPGISEVARRRVDVSSVAGLTMLHVAPPIRHGAAVVLKAAMDWLGAGLLLGLLTPVLAVVALAVRLDSPGPALHRQIRVGQGGRPFRMLKFRTMVSNAEQLKAELAQANEQDGRMFKIRRDPRITRAGRVLRRYSLDELPQLFNVLQGHMSLVGPRPPLPDEAAGYNAVELRRLSVKPGLTGLWQVSGRSDLSWDETVALDLRYVDNWSPSVDFGVLCRTLRAVVEGNGAY
ncbi:sugar transferase [Streptomyces sp. NPDC059828]|uniref:sugar transferase n=1 Tax=Streptomyces sp. NPDC059828 TaxID=3346965 RepID=UPI0036476D2F